MAPRMVKEAAGIFFQAVVRMAIISHDRDKTETGDAIAEVRYIPAELDPPFPEEGARPKIQDIAVGRKTLKNPLRKHR